MYYRVVKKRKYRNILLLVASLGFYAWGEPWFVFIMLLSIMVNWIFGLLVDKHREHSFYAKMILSSMVVFNLGIMFIFKYLIFTVGVVDRLVGIEINIPTIILPIGISFFTFQAISYVVDVYREKGNVQKNPLSVGLYISFFPQLIAGPIVRYETVADQINNREENIEDISQGICRFILGLSKKVLLSNTLAIVADKAFELNGSSLTISFAWLGAVAYMLQIFFDFSGYSDMAIGLGMMFGFHFNENFNYPYIAKSISEFWRRWHISLGSWFRDYVYFPLGGSRVSSRWRLVFNLFAVWILTGVWHGANWTFIVWGMYFFVLIAIEKIFNIEQRFLKFNWLKHITTLMLVLFGWVLFRAESIGEAIIYLQTMFGMNTSVVMDSYFIRYFSENIVYIILAVIFSTPIAKYVAAKVNGDSMWCTIAYSVLYVGIFVLTISYLIKGTYNPFIYFNF
ncbi:MAG: MBOAT family O-acyltransferase [Cellulosilyticaceae bacterium]